MAASWTFHNFTSLRLELYDWRPIISKTSDLDIDVNSVLGRSVVNILPQLVVCMRSHRFVEISSGKPKYDLPHLWFSQSQSKSVS